MRTPMCLPAPAQPLQLFPTHSLNVIHHSARCLRLCLHLAEPANVAFVASMKHHLVRQAA